MGNVLEVLFLTSYANSEALNQRFLRSTSPSVVVHPILQQNALKSPLHAFNFHFNVKFSKNRKSLLVIITTFSSIYNAILEPYSKHIRDAQDSSSGLMRKPFYTICCILQLTYSLEVCVVVVRNNACLQICCGLVLLLRMQQNIHMQKIN